ncbi:hypothetical protein PENVUL_c039G09954 [Penicillium vulpinum]|uniref:Uncharacterized protein n=1 Tax=Penicillium vulpinum TaxID=29845 RepID=A0A1V6RLQ4_9EURO|nr:hypothetical protein PENVUL_c039G09954 [Penicillium vulpinum]
MADAPTDIRYDRVWFYEMDDLSNDRDSVDIEACFAHPEKLN